MLLSYTFLRTLKVYYVCLTVAFTQLVNDELLAPGENKKQLQLLPSLRNDQACRGD